MSRAVLAIDYLTNLKKKYKVNSDIDIKNIVNPQIQDIRSNAVIDIDFSKPEIQPSDSDKRSKATCVAK